jgi:hypothetical protein
MPEFKDREIICKDCGQPFVFTAGSQQFFVEKGFNDPVRCKPCKAKKQAAINSKSSQGEPGPFRRPEKSGKVKFKGKFY